MKFTGDKADDHAAIDRAIDAAVAQITRRSAIVLFCLAAALVTPWLVMWLITYYVGQR